MTISKISQLKHAHFEHKLWKNELEMVSQEVSFFLKIVDEYKEKALNDTHNLLLIAEFVKQFHHFQRLTKRLLEELGVIEKEVVQGVLDDNILDTEQKKDREYLDEEMKYFEYNYRETKLKFRDFIANYSAYMATV